MPAVIVTQYATTQDLPFLPQQWTNHHQYSRHVLAEGWPGWVVWMNTGTVYPPNVVTNLSTNQGRHSLTILMWQTPIPLCINQPGKCITLVAVTKKICNLYHYRGQSFKKPDNKDIDMKSLTLPNVQYCIVCLYAVCNLFFSIFVYFLQIQIV